ncbi:MAG: tetratricopeptide repeat protein, partial [Chitinivibrionales bacterium]|nr:tetratricopeptide repeat protein [Chitinivibrionales bacterium]
MRESQANIRKLQALEERLKEYLRELGIEEVRRTDDPSGFTAERRYLNMMRDSVRVFTEQTRAAQGKLERARGLEDDTADSVIDEQLAGARTELDSVDSLRERYQQEYDLILSECFGDRLDQQRRAEDARQAQFVDWSFRKYQEKKEELVELNVRIGELQRDESDSSADRGSRTKLEFARAARAKLADAIESDRRRLANLVASLVDMNPGGMYNAELLMRLAELYYDRGTDEFAAKLQEYEQRMAEGTAKQELEFPDMNLDAAIEVYARIAKEYPKSDVADAALFYQALALRKVGREERANEVMLALIDKYPQSPYFVEANMNVGRYYFEHPTVQNNQGYTLAEEAFRRVLYYRDHPQFVQALYHLGWCYYMQDQYEEAIAVFRYLVEEVDLDFDQAAREEKQITNPLLREEAIDYIAIAFDERGDLQEAIRFLRLIGSFDYSSVVLKRMGELREEVHDVEAALEIYEFLEAEYPVTIAAPDASLNAIKIYEATDRIDQALEERESFFNRFASGSQWQQRYAETDPATAQRVDSLAVAIGMYVGDAYYRRSNETGETQHFESAARNYLEVVKRYPDSPQAADARWNLAVILQNKLGREKIAFGHYIEYSKIEGADQKRREQAALNAVAIAQAQIPQDSAGAEEAFTVATGKLLEAVDNYTKNFPEGESRAEVMLAQASVFFNRRMYGNAAKIYEDIVALGDTSASHYEALYHLGQCRYEQEKWGSAAEHFKTVLEGSPDPQQRVAAKKLLLQSKYLAAKKLIAAQQYEHGAQALLAIERNYPGSEQSDIVLFNAAEALEKQQKWTEASEVYYRLVDNYPTSKYAPDALFNAASNFERIDDYRKAAEAYERLVDKYSDSRKAKDGLFNLGFCYEKLEEPEKMAQAQERYARLYPEEKDVEAMMIRSANYYLKAGRPEKALAVYRTYTIRFPRNDRCVEAVFRMGRAYEKMDDEHNARLQYLEAQKLDRQFVEQGSAGNSYYAAEAAYYLARMQEKEFDAIQLELPAKVLKQRQQKKAQLLTEVAAAYQRVIEYQSERMFEAAYRIGELYDKLSQSWLNQEQEKLDPIQQAVFDKELYTLASALIQKSFIPYRKTIELAEGFDSLGMEQKHWVGKARENLQKNYLRAGEYLVKAVSSMQNAPVPKKIREKPVYLYQYQKQLYETLEPMKKQARDYYLSAHHELKKLKYEGDAADQCANSFMRLNFRIGADYQELAARILASTSELPKNLDEIEREEIVFQLEDIVFELQD